MTTITHTRHVHINASPEQVFEHVGQPQNIFAAMRSLTGEDAGNLANVAMAPDGGVGSVYEWRFRALMIPVHVTVTREEFVPGERIVDRTSSGGGWIFTVAPEDGGTRLTATMEVSSRVPGLARLEDKLEWRGDEDLDAMLAAHKAAIEG